MRVFLTKWFARYSRREGISESSLRDAIERAERGLIDADLGGGLIKLRIAREGKGRSGGFRMIVAYRIKDRAVFLFGFAKSERENIDPGDLVTVRQVAGKWLALDGQGIALAVTENELTEIDYDGEKA
jgi:hypothetical protein